MVEDANGAVVIVGGFSQTAGYDDIFRLSDSKSEWRELPQKLSHQRSNHIAFHVPDTYAKCVPT